jgi:hypothetical protein
MESNIKSSFIPKDAGNLGSVAVQRYTRARSGLSEIMLLFGVVLLIASIALGVGSFLYLNYLQSSYTNGIETLKRSGNDDTFVAEVTRSANRMSVGGELLSTHTAPSILFDLLEQLTLQTVSYDDLKYDATQGGEIVVSMQGVASSVNSIALQAEKLSENVAFSSPIFTNISRQKDGVHFLLTTKINPAALNYGNTILSENPAPTDSLPQTTPTNIPLFTP